MITKKSHSLTVDYILTLVFVKIKITEICFQVNIQATEVTGSLYP